MAINFLLAFIAKPAVLALTLALLLRLHRDRSVPGAGFLLAGTALFFVGEALCGVDMYVLHGMTLTNEAGHDLLMALGAGVFLVGVHDHLRTRCRCLNRECGRYWSCPLPAAACAESDRYGGLPPWLLTAGSVAAVLPMLAPPQSTLTELPAGIRETVVGTYLYDRSSAVVQLEQLWIPATGALLLLLAATAYATRGRLTRPGLYATGLGVGLVGFAWFRASLVHLFPETPGVGALWEEILEGVGVVVALAWWAGTGSAGIRNPTASGPRRRSRTRGPSEHTGHRGAGGVHSGAAD